MGFGEPDGVFGLVEGGPAAAQQPVRLVVVGVQEALEFLGGQRPDRQAAALVERRAQLLQVLLVVVVAAGVLVVEVVGVGAHVDSFLPAHLAAVPLLVAECSASGAAGSFAAGMPVVTVLAVPTPAG